METGILQEQHMGSLERQVAVASIGVQIGMDLEAHFVAALLANSQDLRSHCSCSERSEASTDELDDQVVQIVE